MSSSASNVDATTPVHEHHGDESGTSLPAATSAGELEAVESGEIDLTRPEPAGPFGLDGDDGAVPSLSASDSMHDSLYASAEGVMLDAALADQRIRVFARFRPINDYERDLSEPTADPSLDMTVARNATHLTVRQTKVSRHSERVDVETRFQFARVFEPACPDAEINTVVCTPVIEAFVAGRNASLVAYGQTGAGKTHTMSAMTHESVNEVFRLVALTRQRAQGELDFFVHVACVEVYNETVRDLLATPEYSRENVRLMVRTPTVANANARNMSPAEYAARQGGLILNGTNQVRVESPEEALQRFAEAQQARFTAKMDSNAHSSRSHSVSVVTLERNDSARRVRSLSQLYLVDLAGSETVQSSTDIDLSWALDGVVDERELRRLRDEAAQRECEGQFINTSLLALGNVIQALSKQTRLEQRRKHDRTAAPVPHVHIPYRDSKLTRILQNSFGSDSCTTLIVCCSTARVCTSQTLSTLRFGDRAASIRNHAPTAGKDKARSLRELESLLAAANASLALERARRVAVEGRLRLAQHNCVVLRTGNVDKHTTAAACAQNLMDDVDPTTPTGDALLETPLSQRTGPLLSMARAQFVCPISGQFMVDPVVAVDGFTYDRFALRAYWSAHGRISPVTEQPLFSSTLLPNHLVRTLMTTVLGATGILSAHTPSTSAALPPLHKLNYFDFLPAELLVHIFSFLHDTPAALAQLDQTSRRFHAVLVAHERPLWTPIALRVHHTITPFLPARATLYASPRAYFLAHHRRAGLRPSVAPLAHDKSHSTPLLSSSSTGLILVRNPREQREPETPSPDVRRPRHVPPNMNATHGLPIVQQ